MSDDSSIQWALDIMNKDLDPEPWFGRKYRIEIITLVGVVASPFMYGKWRQVPWYTKLPTIIPVFIIPATVGAFFIVHRGKKYTARKDASVIEYIKLHPDRFPEPENRQLKDVLEPWMPMR